MEPQADVPTRTPRVELRRRSARILAAPVLAVAVVLAAVVPAPVSGATTWSRNLYVSSAFLYQDPYYTACTAASAMIMLNTIAYRGTGGGGFRWTPYRVKSNKTDPDDRRDMTSILAFSRKYDTLRSTSAGSDAHGWRNALNYYGWGKQAMTDPTLRPYEDRAYKSFGSAVKAAVKAIARLRMPVGVLTWAGGHAQVMTGYVVEGKDPRVSSDFTVKWVYLSDPLRESSVVNRRTSYDAFKSGALRYRFQWYRETDSPYDDPYTPGTIRSSVKPTTGPSEWYHRWVLVLPVRPGLPAAPPPDPDPTPVPSTSPTPDPTPASTLEPSDSPPPEPTQESSQEPSSEPAPVEPSSSSSSAPSLEPSLEPSQEASVEPASGG